jgi:putative transposase
VRFTTCIISRGSLHARNAHDRKELRITLQAGYLSLRPDDVTCLDAYRRLFASMDAHDIDALRLHTQQQKPWGSERS